VAQSAPNKRTTSVVVPTKRKMIALTAEEAVGDRGVPDFVKWVENFGRNDTGHFLDEDACKKFAEAARKLVAADYAQRIDSTNLDGFCKVLALVGIGGQLFTSEEALDHFLNQVQGYVDNDEFIGTPPSTSETKETPIDRKQSRNNRRRRKTS
jgi:hypothetical protein